MQHFDYRDMWDDPHYEGLLFDPAWADQVAALGRDQLLQDQVAMRIVNDDRMPLFDQEHIMVDVKDGIVRLTGRVQQLISKPLAFLDTIYIPGVLGVQDEIEVVTL